jgi:hypothetical protein
MDKRSTWRRRGSALVMAFAVVMVPFAAGWAPVATAQVSRPCTEEGTWHGVADNGFTWMNTITRGVDATRGQLDLAWVTIDPTLGGTFANAARVTPARGVWSKVGRKDALWTWIAYASEANGTPAYAIRSSGRHHMPDCEHLDIEYALEIFLPSQDMATDPPIAVPRGTARETRMPLIQVPSGS